MAYESGSATGPVDLLQKLAYFAQTNGWTIDNAGAQGNGYVLQIHRGSVYANYRAMVNEAYPSGVVFSGYSPVYGILCSPARGYSSSQPWYDQIGRLGSDPVNGTAGTPYPLGIGGMVGAIPYYFFYTSGNNLYMIVELESGYFNHLCVGELEKYFAFNGGQWFAGPYLGPCDASSLNSWKQKLNYYHIISSRGSRGSSEGIPAFYIYAENGSYQEWHGAEYSLVYPPRGRPSARRVASAHYGQLTALWGLSSVASREEIVFWPETVMIYRGDGRAAIAGTLKDLYTVKMTTLAPKQQITVGSDTYIVFPYRTRETTYSGMLIKIS